MSVRVVWYDPGAVDFEEIEAEPDGADVFATWSEAKASALASCVDNARTWQSCAHDLRSMSRAQALGH